MNEIDGIEFIHINHTYVKVKLMIRKEKADL